MSLLFLSIKNVTLGVSLGEFQDQDTQQNDCHTNKSFECLRMDDGRCTLRVQKVVSVPVDMVDCNAADDL